LQVDLDLLNVMVGTPWDPQLTAPKGRPKKSQPPQAVPVPAIAMEQVGRLNTSTEQAQAEPEAEGAPARAQHAEETDAAAMFGGTDADVVTAPMGVDDDPPLTPVRTKRKLEVQWEEALGSPVDNSLKRKAEGEQGGSDTVGGLVTMT
jgi:hypothetical protein